MILDILLPVGRLIVATLVGFALFKIHVVKRLLLDPFVFLIVNIVFPLYFAHTIPSQWASGIDAGWEWMAFFFAAFAVFFVIQFALAKLLVNRVPLMRTKHPQELLVLFAMHNAGYIPIPLIAALAPPAVSVYMSFYVMAFVLSFFTVAVWIIQRSAEIRAEKGDRSTVDSPGPAGPNRARPRFKLNAPLVGIVLGLVFALTGVYDDLPGWVRAPFRWSSVIALDAIMVVLGAVLASIPSRGISFKREFGGLILFKMVLFPLAVLGIMALIPLRNLAPDVAAGIRLAMVLEAAVPPATNVLVITKAYGTKEQVEYAGSAIMATYAASVVLLPAFLIVSRVVFG
ncbi:MAG: AEC family transporter [Spirochaetales bacterium]